MRKIAIWTALLSCNPAVVLAVGGPGVVAKPLPGMPWFLEIQANFIELLSRAQLFA